MLVYRLQTITAREATVTLFPRYDCYTETKQTRNCLVCVYARHSETQVQGYLTSIASEASHALCPCASIDKIRQQA
jgi:hypothetical protein